MSSSHANDLQDAPAPSSPRSFGEIRGFNGLRGVAVLIVFVAHMDVFLPIPTLLVVPGATVSLNSFFVLSGFLITALLLREQARHGKIGIRAFYRRRVLRLLPALYVMVLAASLFMYFTHEWTKAEVPSIFSVVFYYSNYYSSSAASPFSPKLANGFQHLWSLSFEEQFYLLWPWITIVLLTIRTRLRTVVIVLLSLIALIAIHRFASYQMTGGKWWTLFYRTDIRADSILWGSLLAHLWMRWKEPKWGMRWAPWLAAAFLMFCLPIADQSTRFIYWGGFVGIDIACAILILALLEGRWAGCRFFEWKPWVALGLVSYAFYLWHLPVYFGIRHFDTHWNYVVRVIVAITVTLALTIASWFLLEKPLQRWSRRLESRRYGGSRSNELVRKSPSVVETHPDDGVRQVRPAPIHPTGASAVSGGDGPSP